MRHQNQNQIPIQVHIPIISDKQSCCPFEKPFGYIYLITNKINGHMYVRKHEFHHPWIDKSYKGSGKALQSAYEKYGEENFDIIILEWTNLNDTELNNLEIYWIDMFGTYKFPFHYNLTPGGDGISSEVISGENNYWYGKFGPEHPAYGKHSNAGCKNPMYGKFGPEHPVYGTVGPLKGVTGKNHPCYNKHINVGKNNPMYGKTGKEHPNSKPVIQRYIDTNNIIRTFEYIKQVAEFGFDPNAVLRCCKGKQKQYKGYKWEYL